MPLFLQRILAYKDRKVSQLFRFQSWCTGEVPVRSLTFFVDRGPTIGIVGIDGKIHTMLGRHAVRHEYRGGRLIRRSLVRKSLTPDERLATASEIATFKEKLRERFEHGCGICD